MSSRRSPPPDLRLVRRTSRQQRRFVLLLLSSWLSPMRSGLASPSSPARTAGAVTGRIGSSNWCCCIVASTCWSMHDVVEKKMMQQHGTKGITTDCVHACLCTDVPLAYIVLQHACMCEGDIMLVLQPTPSTTVIGIRATGLVHFSLAPPFTSPDRSLNPLALR